MIPQKLSEWNLDVIKNLLEQGYYESEDFDFKENLSKGKENIDRLTKTCCAFANRQNGGFLVFGISNNRKLPVEERIIGIDSIIDLPEHFGVYPQKTTPTTDWDFLKSPIKVNEGKLIHVFYIKPALFSPVGYCDDSKWFFMKRTNKGNELMSYEEIKLHFMNFYEKRIKLNLLHSELNLVIETADNMQLPEERVYDEASLYRFNIQIIESVLVDTYTILASNESLLGILKNLRSQCQLINDRQSIYWNYVGLEKSHREKTMTHIRFVNQRLPKIKEWASKGIEILKEIKLTV